MRLAKGKGPPSHQSKPKKTGGESLEGAEPTQSLAPPPLPTNAPSTGLSRGSPFVKLPPPRKINSPLLVPRARFEAASRDRVVRPRAAAGSGRHG